MKIVQAIFISIAAFASAEGCMLKELHQDIDGTSDRTRLVTFGRSKVRKSSGKTVGFEQGYCVMSHGPEDKQSELCTAVIELDGESVHLSYYYPLYKNGGDGPSEFEAVITAATGSCSAQANKRVPAKFDGDTLIWYFNKIQD
jgi:hypothetical protein